MIRIIQEFSNDETTALFSQSTTDNRYSTKFISRSVRSKNSTGAKIIQSIRSMQSDWVIE